MTVRCELFLMYNIFYYRLYIHFSYPSELGYSLRLSLRNANLQAKANMKKSAQQEVMSRY